jgi:tetratricopeptide (TPR) repeat protein
MLRTGCALLLFATFSFAQQPNAPAAAPGSPADLVQRGEKLSHEGKQDEALALYQQALDKAGDIYAAHLGAGLALDLKGDYDAAREHLNKAIELAPAAAQAQVLRAMAVSYAFQDDAAKASEYEMRVFSARMAKDDLVGAAEICNETGRMYLESGDFAQAEKWYGLGYKTIGDDTNLSPADKNLWLFRWESAEARIAARRNQAQEAQKHVAAAKAALDQANNPDQLRFYPYLTGYVAYYTGDYKNAVTVLQTADQHDPLNLLLLGEAYEKLGDQQHAKSYYQQVLQINVHNPTNAYARPIARKKLGGA